MSYVVYHLEEMEKVGCTNRFEARMKEQGFEPLEEYKKYVTQSIEEASMVEAELRKFYGYKEDSNMTYLEKFRGDDNSSTLTKVWKESHYVGLNELKKGASKQQLSAKLNEYDNISLTTKGGTWTFSRAQYGDLLRVAMVSQHRDFYWSTKNLENISNGTNKGNDGKDSGGVSPCKHGTTIPEFQQIRDWAEDKGIFTSGDPKTQYIKLQEEAGEVAKALLKQDEPEIIDGLGDCLVVLINLSHLCGYKLEDCLQSAYDVISKRKGKMENGTFIKEETL